MTTAAPEPKPPPKRENPRPWPTYGYDAARTHISPYDHRPPYRRALVDRRPRHARVPADDRLRARVPGPAEGPLLRARREDRQGRLEEEPQPLRRVLADDRRGRRLPVVHAPGGLPAGAGGRRRLRGRLGRRRPAASAGASSRRRSSPRRCCAAAASTSAPGTTTSTRSTRRPGAQIWSFQADDEVNTSAAYWKRTIYIASDGGHALRAQRADRQAALERAVGLEVRVARVLLRHPDGRLRPRLHRQHRRHDVRVRREERQAALGAAARHLHLRRGRRLEAASVRGHLRRQVLRARRRHRRHRLADRRARRGARRARPSWTGSSTTPPARAAAPRRSASVKQGPDGTYAVRASNGRQVWRFPGGKYANPVVADEDRVYVTGRAQQFAFRRAPSSDEHRNAPRPSSATPGSSC